jgi:hypothetical protein
VINRQALFVMGKQHIFNWCDLNSVGRPEVHEMSGNKPTFGVCAYYRDGHIYIWVNACARIGMGGAAWSYPSYTVDHTPYGVLAHELGHHVDRAHGSGIRPGSRSHLWPASTGEAPLTGYCPDNNEWFAEHFRLFVTNPNLLAAVRPRVFALMKENWSVFAESRRWEDVLNGADRQIKAAHNKIRAAR